MEVFPVYGDEGGGHLGFTYLSPSAGWLNVNYNRVNVSAWTEHGEWRIRAQDLEAFVAVGWLRTLGG